MGDHPSFGDVLDSFFHLHAQVETLEDVQLGHKSYQTTLRYAHLAPDQEKDAVNLFAKEGITGHNTVTSDSPTEA